MFKSNNLKISTKNDKSNSSVNPSQMINDLIDDTNDVHHIHHIQYNDDEVILFEPNIPNVVTPLNERMIKILNKIKCDLFDPMAFPYWNCVAICGGFIIDCLYNIDYSSDIDLYIYNVRQQSKIDTIASTITQLINGTIVCETKGVMTLKGSKSNKKVQIINTTNKSSIQEILDTFDIEACKLAFDGYQIIYGMKNRYLFDNNIIKYNDDLRNKQQSINRLAKYVHKKKFGLIVKTSDLNNIDPLYLFKESHGFDKFMQLTKLYQDGTLQNIYKMLVIKKNFASDNLNAMIKYAKSDSTAEYSSDSAREEGTLTGKSLTSYIKDQDIVDIKSYNQFGQPVLFEKIRKGNYKFDDLYEQQIVDACGFNTTCMMVLFEPNEDAVINFIKEIYKVGSKNTNKYKINYLTMACLLNRLKIVTFLMNQNNYKDVMNIAVKEDNVELYKLAYCTYSPKERYLYDKKTLLEYKSYNLYKELYDANDLTYDNEDSDEDSIEKIPSNMPIDDLIVLFSTKNQNEREQILKYIIKHTYKTIEEIENEYFYNSMIEVEQILYKIYYKKINEQCSGGFNAMLRNLVSVDKYKESTVVKYHNPLKTLSFNGRANLIKIYKTRKIDATYRFDDIFINDLIIHLDDPNVIKSTPFKRFLMDMLVGKKLGPNLNKYFEEQLRKTTDPTLYSEILGNNSDHDSVYKYSILKPNYIRQENALGYTPCDIIIYQTLRDYMNNYGVPVENVYPDPQYSSKYIENRRKSIKMINLNAKIVNYEGKVNFEKVKALLPELFIY